jgi:hypothetical protein
MSKHKNGLLCKLGWHRPLSFHEESFRDCVSGKMVYDAECTCGKAWLVDSTCGYLGFKIEKRKE